MRHRVDFDRQATWEWLEDHARAFELAPTLWADMAASGEWILAVSVVCRRGDMCVVQLATRLRIVVFYAQNLIGSMRFS